MVVQMADAGNGALRWWVREATAISAKMGA
jgi:hypothetical protein